MPMTQLCRPFALHWLQPVALLRQDAGGLVIGEWDRQCTLPTKLLRHADARTDRAYIDGIPIMAILKGPAAHSACIVGTDATTVGALSRNRGFGSLERVLGWLEVSFSRHG